MKGENALVSATFSWTSSDEMFSCGMHQFHKPNSITHIVPV
jgi:hypothetical protein